MVLRKMPYGPVVDAEYTNDPVVPATLDKMLKNDAHVPIIIGHTVHESLLGFSSTYRIKTRSPARKNIILN